MKKRLMTVMLALLVGAMVQGCVIAPGPPYYETEVVQPLPTVVELYGGPYYQYRGYHYYYHDDRWRYSRDRHGPWRDLPRSYWPRETRSHGRGEFRGERR